MTSWSPLVVISFAKIARRDFQLGINVTGVGVDDPDANFNENFRCGSQRNYSDYCNAALEKRMDEQSREVDFNQRLKIVQEIDMTLQEEVARPILAFRMDYYAHWPYVKNFIPHPVMVNFGRMQEVWLDK